MHRIEPAPTARASCRGCKRPIDKGALRFAEEFQSPYSEEGGTSFRYWHLECAATKLANDVGEALSAYARPPMPFAHPACVARYLDRERELGRNVPDRGETIRSIVAHSRVSAEDLEVVRREMAS